MKVLNLLLCLSLCVHALAGCAPKTGTPAVDIDLPTPALTAAPAHTVMPAAIPSATQPAATRLTAPPITPSPKPEDEVPQRDTPVANEAFYHQTLDAALRERITGMSYPAPGESCAISYDDLRYIGLLYYDFAGKVHTGELIVHRKVANEVVEIFYALYENQYPLASVRLVDDFGEPGDDNKSMAANNTSAFNYRRVTNSKKLSRHSYGAAIDINPLYNPYIEGGRVAPPAGAEYVDRSRDFPGKIDHDDLCYQLFTQYGWSWGGDFENDKDYQHFSKDLGY